MKEGYKKTEVGVIPEDWEVKKLEDVVDKSNRYSFTGGPFGSDLKSEHYTETGVRIIQLQNIGDGYFNDEYKIYTSVEKADELISCNIYPGDIIIAKMAEPVARACIIPLNESRYLMCSDGIRVNVNNSEYDKRYILYAINSSYFRKNAEANSTGSTRLRIGLNQLKNLNIIIPPLKEQEKIADILSIVDCQIDYTEMLIEKCQELKKGLMQRLLTKGVGHKEFKQSEVGEIPVEWEVKKLEDVSYITMGQSPSSDSYNDKGLGIPFFQGNSEFGNIYPTVKKWCSEPKKIAQPLDILISVRAPVGAVNINNDRACIGRGLASIRQSNKINYMYLYYVLSISQDILNSSAQGSTFTAINSKDLKNFKIAIPSLKEQEKITKMLSSIDNEIEDYKNKKEKLEELKKGLMQQLLTGKIRTV